MSATALHVIIGPGVLGRTIAKLLAQQGKPVRLVSRSGQGAGLAGVEACTADVLQPEQARRAVLGAGVVYHCAAPAYHRWAQDFPALQAAILRAASDEGAVLVAAENLYGYGVAGTLTEAMPLTATTRKGRVRADLSRLLFAAHAAGQVRAVAGRAADFFGPGVRTSAFGERVWPNLRAGRAVDWFGDPDAAHSLTYVPDFARALITLGQEPRAWGRAWHVPSPPALSPRAVMTRAAGLAGVPPPRVRAVPTLMLRAVGLFLPAAAETIEMKYSYDAPFVMDDSAFRAAFGAAATGWDAALQDTLDSWAGAAAARAA